MEKYHFTECGLDNVYLVNGFEITKYPNGDEAIYFHAIHDLQKAIGKALIFKRSLLSGKEIRFIRHTLDLSQTALGNILGCTYQTILLWEKDKTQITKASDHFLRVIFFAYLNNDNSYGIYDKINQIAALDADLLAKTTLEKIELEEVADEWHLVA